MLVSNRHESIIAPVNGPGGGAGGSFVVLTKTSDQTGIGSSTTKVTWEAAVVEGDSALDNLSSNRIDILIDGIFAVSACADADGPGPYAWFYIYKNGSEVASGRGEDAGTPSGCQTSVGAELVLAPGDYVEIYVYFASGSNHKVMNNSNEWTSKTYFKVCKVA